MKKQQLELDMELYEVTESCTRQKLNWTELNFVQLDHGESKEIPEKNKTKQNKNYFCFLHYIKAFDCVDHNKLENS